mgnify:CR=1 FL=1
MINDDHGKKSEQKLKNIKAKDLMSKFAITIREDETITTLAHLMMRFKISGIPVCTKNGDIIGIVTATDLFNFMKKIVLQMEKAQDVEDCTKIKVTDLMTHDVVTITEETSLYEMMKIMCERNIHTLPVMVLSKKEIIGVIGRRDILNAFYVGVGSELK